MLILIKSLDDEVVLACAASSHAQIVLGQTCRTLHTWFYTQFDDKFDACAPLAPATMGTPPIWQKQAWWPLVCPDGVHFAPWVVDWVELPRSADLFLPGQGRSNEEGVGLPDFRVLALRADFGAPFVLPLRRRCLRRGCPACQPVRAAYS